ncbi:MAG: VCBS domain-containing protein, partial [Cyclobacteriaceae bacterium]
MQKTAVVLLAFLFCQFSLHAQTISGTVNEYAAVSNSSGSVVTVTNAGDIAGWTSGDKILLIQIKGTVIDETNTSAYGDILSFDGAGNYEFNTISSVSGNLITLDVPTCKTYLYDIHPVQVIRVPVYTDVTVNGDITGQAWNGTTGGVIALEVSGTLTLSANIDASGIGFRGGDESSSSTAATVDLYVCDIADGRGGIKGEGIIEIPDAACRGKLANGGGGGNDHNSGGGGGGNYGTGGLGGDGWPTETGEGGVGGISLIEYYTEGLPRLFLGGGGGGGHQNNGATAPGSDGGGIIFLTAGTLNVTSTYTITAASPDATDIAINDGAGGGGAGGSILLNIDNYTNPANLSIDASGGDGASLTTAAGHGPGGGGGGGFIFSNITLPGGITTDLTGGQPGIFTSTGTDPTSGTSRNAAAGDPGSILQGNLIVQVCSSPPALDLNTAVGGDDNAFTFTEGDAATGIATNGNVDVVDSDDVNLEYAQITLLNPQDATSENLSVADAANIQSTYGISVSISVDGYTADLLGSASLADYETVLSMIRYFNNSVSPTVLDRNIQVVVDDGGATDTATAVVTIISVNTAPSLDLDGSVSGNDFSTTFQKSGSASPIADADNAISDTDDTNIESATITLTNRLNGSNETLSVSGTLPSGITVTNSYDNIDGIIEISGSASISDYQTAINQIVYENVSTNPNNSDRIITLTVSDGDLSSNTVTTTMSIKFPPTLTAIGPVETTLEENEVEIDFLEISNNADESDADGSVTAFVVQSVLGGGSLRIGATEASAAAFASGTNDVISTALGLKAFWTPALNESGTLGAFTVLARDNEDFESDTPVTVPVIVTEVNDLPVAGNDSGSTNQATTVIISDISSDDTDVDGTVDQSSVVLIDPSNNLNTGALNTPLVISGVGTFTIDVDANLTFEPESAYTGNAIVNYTVKDDIGGESNEAMVTITVTGNTAPTVDLDGNDDSGITGNDLTQSVLDASAGTIVVDDDVTITDATDTQMESVTITLTNRPDGINESLYVDGTLPPGVTVTDPYSNADGILVISGIADIEDYQNILKIIKYIDTATVADVTDRVITVTVNDGTLNSTVATSTLKIGCGNFTLLDFRAPTLETNVAGTIGDIYRFDDVATGLDARVEITGLVNATLTDIDDDSGNIETLRPFLTATDATSDMYIDLKITIIDATTSLAVPLGDVSIVGGDVDGINGTRDFMGVKDSPGITIENTNNLNRDFEDNFTTFTSSNNNDVNPGDADEPLHTVYSVFKNASTYEVRGGSKQLAGGGGNDGTRVVEFNLANACYFESYADPRTTPSSAGKTIVLNEDESFNFNDVDFSFEDPDGNAFDAVIIRELPVSGTLFYNGGAAAIDTEYTDKTLFTFTPGLNENGNPYAEFIFQVKDDSGHPETEFSAQRDTIAFKVLAVNDVPVATNDTYSISEGGTLTVNDADGTTTGGDSTDDGVGVNDSDADGDNLTIELVTAPLYNGTSFTLNSDGTFIYTHDGSENFTDTFTYKVTDPDGESSIATVTINISPVNDPPTIDLDGDNSSGATAFDYFTSFQEGGAAVAISDTDILISDGDLSDDIESVTIILTNRPDGANETLSVSGTLPGSLVVSDIYDNADGQLVISGTGTPAEYQQAIQLVVYQNAGVGPDVADRNVTIVVTDGDDDSNTATANIVVSPADDFDNDGIKDINDLDDDNDGIPDSQEFCSDGGFACLPGGLDPSGDADGDGISNYQDADDVNFTNGCTDNGSGVCVSLVAAYDPDGDQIPNHKDYNSDGDNCSDADESGHGEVVLTGGVITGPYGANGLANRVETFDESGNVDYTISEKVAGTYNAQSATCDQCVPALDLDADNSSGAVADTDFNTSFTEGDVNVSIADVDTDITDINDVNITQAIIVLTNRPDGTDESLSVSGTLPPGISIIDAYNNNDGQLVLSGSAAISSYEAAIEQIVYNNSSSAPDLTTRQVTVIVYDSENASNTATAFIGITAQNSDPVAAGDTNAATEGTVSIGDTDGSGTLIVNDTDADGDGLTVSSINGVTNTSTDITGTYGTLNWEADGTYTYTLDNSATNGLAFSETVTDTFTYTVSDGSGTDTETLIITITGTNDNPVAVDDTNQITSDGATLSSITETDGSGTLLVNDSDVDGDNLNVASVTSVNVPANTSNDPGTPVAGQYGTLTWNNDGTYTYTFTSPPTIMLGMPLTEVFTYQSSDANASVAATLTITIVDDSREINIAVVDGSGTEGSDNAIQFNIALSGGDNDSGGAITVFYTISGTSTNGDDYTTLSGSADLPTGASSNINVDVVVTDDAIVECGTETLILTLSPTSPITIGTNNSASATIADNETISPNVSVANVCSGEDIQVQVTNLTNLPDGLYDIAYNIDGGGTATASDVSVSGEAAAFTVSGLADGLNQTLNITGVCDKTVSASNTTFDVTTPSSASAITGTTEICAGESTNLVVNITGGTSPYTVALSDGTTINSYTTGSNIAVMPTVTTAYTVVSITDTNGCVGSGNTGTATVTVNNGSTAATINGATTICEGTSTNLTVNITGGTSPYTVQLSYGSTINSYVSGTAIPVSPTTTTAYTITSIVDSKGCTGTGNTATATVTIVPIPTIDSSVGNSPTTFGGSDGSISLTFSGVPDGTYNLTYDGGTFSNINIESGAVTISGLVPGDYNNIAVSGSACPSVDDIDVTIAQSATLSIAQTTDGAENDSGSTTPATFTVSLDKTNETGSPITVNYSFTGGTATSGTDYNNGTTSVNILNNTSSAIITVPVNEDAVDEATETIQVTISGAGLPTGISLGTSSAIAAIGDDDTAEITISDDTKAEGTALVFTVTLSNASDTDIDIPYTTNDGSATTGDSDYTDNDNTLTISAGDVTGTITVVTGN